MTSSILHWENSVGGSTFTFGGKEYPVRSDEDFMNPFFAGETSEAIPVSAEPADGGIKVTYITRNGSVITGMWTLPERGDAYRDFTDMHGRHVRNVQHGRCSLPAGSGVRCHECADAAYVPVQEIPLRLRS